MPFTLATWNINSVRLRLALVEGFLVDHAPDVLCLQETKCPNDLFPREAFRALGYGHQAVHGQKGYHGVAILSRHPLEDEEIRDFGDVGHARHQSARLQVGDLRIRLHNVYVPAGGDVPDRAINGKFAHKLDFLEDMRGLLAAAEPGVSALLVGDLNVAPLESDVWSHKQLLKIVSHTPVETEALVRAMTDGGWADLMRAQIGDAERLFTWWSYRSKDWRAADKGRRLDHVWGSPDLVPRLAGLTVLKDARDGDRPSDHVPVLVTLDL